MSAKRYFLDTDNSSHRFIVDFAHKAEWDAWNNLPEDDPAGWEQPAYARRIGGARILFENPTDEHGNRLDF